MPIVYSLIARGTTVFCEHTGDRGNFQQITRTILEKVDNSADAKHSYSYDDHTFHMIVEHGIIYLAMSTREFELSAAFGFLGQIKRQFDQRYQDIFSTAVAFEMNKTFNKVLTEQMDAYNNGGDVTAADPSDWGADPWQSPPSTLASALPASAAAVGTPLCMSSPPDWGTDDWASPQSSPASVRPAIAAVDASAPHQVLLK